VPPPPAEALKRATPENRDVAAVIDAMEKLSDEDLRKARGAAAQGAVAPGYPSGQGLEQTKLDAIEFLFRRRGLERLNVPYSRDPTQRRLYVRTLIEDDLADQRKAGKLGSFDKAMERFAHPAGIEDDIAFFERYAKGFRKEFLNQARETARKMLNQSLQQLGNVLSSYGLPADSAVRTAGDLYHDRTTYKQAAADLIALAKTSGHVDDPKFETKREGLAKQVKLLKSSQDNVRYWKKRSNIADTHRPVSGTGPDWEAANKANADYRAARADLQRLWIKAELEHPIIAAFRRGDDVETVDLGTIDTDPVEDEMREVLLKVLPKMEDIIKVAWLVHIGPDQHGISPLSLPPVVTTTMANMFIPPGSIRAAIVKDMVDDAADEKTWVKIAAVALAIVTLVPSGGASAGLIGIASAGFAAYSAAQAWQQYDTQKSLANTDLDLARSLATVEPSLSGFAWSLVSLGIEGIPLVGAFNKARRIKALMNEGDHVAANALVRELNAEGKGLGKGDLGDQAREEARQALAAEREAAEAEARATKPQGHATEAPKKAPAAEAFAPPPRDPWNTLAEIEQYETEAELREALRKRPNIKKPRGGEPAPGWAEVTHGTKSPNPMMADVMEAIEANRAQIIKDNPGLVENLERAYPKIRDPKFVEDAIVDLWKEAGRRKITPREVLEQRMGGRFTDIRKELPGDQFRAAIAKPDPIRDLEFAQDRHGAYTHMFQEYLVERALGPGKGRELRQQIARAKGPDVIEKANSKKPRPFFSAVWDGMFDDGFGVGHINRPETLGWILQERLGFPQWTPPPP
jgi:hypothetical protein